MNRPQWLATMLAAAALGAAPTPAWAADPPRVFAPSSEWTSGGDDESCWIIRQFGNEDDRITLALQVFGPGPTSYSALLRGEPLPQRDSGALEFETRFSADADAQDRVGVLTSSGGVPRLAFRLSLEPPHVLAARGAGESVPFAVDAEREAAIDALTLTFSRGRPLTLQHGPLSEPLARLRACAAGLVAKWGLDPAVQRSLSRQPVPLEIGTWLAPGSYPWEYLRTYRSAAVNLRLMVDARGTPTECVVQSPRSPSNAGTIACREIMKAARFEPALDAAGEPVPGYFVTSVFFQTRRRNGNW